MLRPALGWACALAGAGILAAFFIGRLASDRWQATQYLHWLPAVPVLLAGALALGLSRAAWPTSARLRRARRGLACVLILACAWIAVFEWRMYNLLRRGAPTGPALTIVHFNASGKPAPALPGGVLALEPDLVVFANLRGRESLPAVRQALSVPRDGLDSAPGGAGLVHAGRFAVVSRLTIAEFGSLTLGFDGAIFLNRDMPELRDPGTAAWFRLAAAEALGRDLVVWAIDLPSDPRLARRDVMTRSMAAIEAWTGPTFVRQEGGNYSTLAHGPGAAGFPAPDVIIGDFNTPGGSSAIAKLARRVGANAGDGRRLVDAHARAGVGADGTFPSVVPRWLGWGIDRALVSDGLDVVRRDVRAVGSSQHRAQRVTVATPAR